MGLADRIGQSSAVVAVSSQLSAQLTCRAETHLLVPVLLWRRSRLVAVVLLLLLLLPIALLWRSVIRQHPILDTCLSSLTHGAP